MNIENSPQDSNWPDGAVNHREAVKLVESILAATCPISSFDMRVVTHDGLTVALVTDNPEFVAERRAVQQDFDTIDTFLKLGEQYPAVGSVHAITIGGRKGRIRFDGMEQLLALTEMGLSTVQSQFTLLPEEQEAVCAFQHRVAALRSREQKNVADGVPPPQI